MMNKFNTIRRTGCAAFVATLVVHGIFASSAPGQDLGHKSPPQDMAIALVNATIHPVSSPSINQGYVLFDKGRIVEVGEGERMFIATIRQIDCTGLHVYPGLISPYSILGLTEIGAVRATHDYKEVGRGGITPEVVAATAVNPDSTVLPVTRSNGILTFASFPGGWGWFGGWDSDSGTLIPGYSSVMRMDGWTTEDMTIRKRAGLTINWPQARPIRADWIDDDEKTQQEKIDETLAKIDDMFHRAQAYLKAARADPLLPTDIQFESMRDIFPEAGEQQRPVFITAHDYDQIISAVAFCRRFGLKPVIVGGRDAHLCADMLREEKVPVIIEGTFRMPKRDDSNYDEPYRLPSLLQEAGVQWSIATGDEAPHERNLPYAAAMAVAHGLDQDAAIRALTLSAAEILGVGDSLGSIEMDKAATLIVTTESPLEITTQVRHAFIDGREINLDNKQTKLRDKYQDKYRQRGELK